jgi:drug/metabolite transporter (DMT)-like permease
MVSVDACQTALHGFHERSTGFALTSPAQHRLGLVLVTLSALTWSMAGFFTRLIHLDSWTMIAWRGLFAAAGMVLFMLLRERRGFLASFRRMGRPGLAFVYLSTIGMTVFLGALQLTTVAHVAIIYATVPFLAAALAWLVMRERPSLSAVIAGLGALAGVAVMVGLSAEGNLSGDLLALCMTFCMAGMMVISRHYQGIAVMPAACLASLLSGLIALPFAQHLAASGTDLFYLALFGLVNSAVGTVLFALGARLLPAIETGLIGALDAPLAPIWVWLAFGELPSGATIIGGLVVFVAVFGHILVSARRPEAKVSEPLTAEVPL